ncbi:cytochrome c oxidase subunit 3 [Methylonatrum kenyense]|uniref:cytochrome c oxidase subunit 3 n=1 Tax=Methylonatrum kenyense TaxID=455253 RepID=UPI0020C0A74A|nr:cytochrome c oxidase subunit 3 [Methylonatrum kenyense]MCK8515159.1 cytochrome c oxidase subunit 3 [Methylonatrum kenyense]
MSFWAQHAPGRGTIEPAWGNRQPWQGPVDRSRVALRGLLLLLVPLTSMFGLVVSAYFMRRHMGDWQAVPLPWQLWLSSALLLASSVAFERARRITAPARLAELQANLAAAGLLALGFLATQVWSWQALAGQGYALAGSAGGSFFYLMSGLHALHLVCGMVAWLKVRTAARVGTELATVQLYVRLCAIYWHFLLAVWLVLFATLLSG